MVDIDHSFQVQLAINLDKIVLFNALIRNVLVFKNYLACLVARLCGLYAIF